MAATGVSAAGEHNHVLDLGVHIGPLVLRVALLAAVPLVAGFALLRGFLPEPGRFTKTAVAIAAATAVFLELMLAGGWDLPTQVVPLLLASLAASLYLVRARDPRAEPFRRLAPILFGLIGTLAAIELARAWFGGDTDAASAVLMHTGVVLALTSLTWFLVTRPGLATRIAAAVLAVVLMGSAAQAIVWRAPYPPPPGVATIHQAVVGPRTLDVLVVPNRPGWNLIHLPADTFEIGTSLNHLTPSSIRPGTTGSWAAVELPAGRTPLWIRQRDAVGIVTTDTGPGPATAIPGLLGEDGPECANALLGQALAAANSLVARCPADALTPADASALQRTVEYLATLGLPRLTLISDSSPRSTSAAQTVRDTAAAAGILVAPPDAPAGPPVVVSGWSTADSALRRITTGGQIPEGGTYLAPWLITGPLLEIRAGARVPLCFDQSDELPRRYRDALTTSFPSQTPSTSGYQAWLAQQRIPDSGPIRIQQVIPHAAPSAPGVGAWFPNETFTALSGAL